ncbi:MAG: tetratricopeptide repeat protein [Merismopedia sp. SIO2A8]|nr:tetratricopeptide repeat protein [Merismopedia sp. SIO2A8]
MWIVGIAVIVGWIGSVCLHEFGHAIVAYWGGDTSVKDKGYLTLNPTKYIDPQMSLVLPTIFLLLGGIALPGAAVYVNDAAIRNRAWRSAVSAAGPMGSAISVLLLSIPFWLWDHGAISRWIAQESVMGGLWAALAFLIFLNVFMVFLNSMPIPPLDGFGVLRPWLPPPLQAKARKFSKYGILVLFGLLWFVRPVNQFLWGISALIVGLLGIPGEAIQAGAVNFRSTTAPILVVAIVGFILYQKFLKPKHQRHWDQGRTLLQSGRYDKALVQFDQAIALDPDFYEPHYGKGIALECLNRPKDALEAYAQASKLNPQMPDPYHRQASLLIRLGHRTDAIAHYQKLAQLEPDNPYHQGSIFFFSGQYEDAIAVYQRILEDEPENAGVWCNQACCYSHLGNLDQVIIHLTRAIEIDRKMIAIAKNDPDLATFRDDPRFQDLLALEEG